MNNMYIDLSTSDTMKIINQFVKLFDPLVLIDLIIFKENKLPTEHNDFIIGVAKTIRKLPFFRYDQDKIQVLGDESISVFTDIQLWIFLKAMGLEKCDIFLFKDMLTEGSKWPTRPLSDNVIARTAIEAWLLLYGNPKDENIQDEKRRILFDLMITSRDSKGMVSTDTLYMNMRNFLNFCIVILYSMFIYLFFSKDNILNMYKENPDRNNYVFMKDIVEKKIIILNRKYDKNKIIDAMLDYGFKQMKICKYKYF